MKFNIEKIRNEKPIEELIKFSVINIDKPTGPPSFSISQYIMKKLNVNKTSHFGVLDPMVTGVLPVALGRACRLNEYFMHRDKEYVGIMRLHKDIDDKTLNEIMKKFVGKITQLPPVRSNVKRAERVREVKSFEILERDGKDVLFKTLVEAGTYIRKICDDAGKEMGGAHMLELRRTKAGIFSEENIVNLYQFDKAIEEYKKGNDKLLRETLTPAEIITTILPGYEIKEEFQKKCLTGSPLFKHFFTKIPKEETGTKIYAHIKDKLIGFYNIKNEGEVIATPEFVLN